MGRQQTVCLYKSALTYGNTHGLLLFDHRYSVTKSKTRIRADRSRGTFSMADPTNLEGAVDCGRNSGSPVSEGDKQTCSPPPPPPPCRDSTGSGGTRRLYLPMDVRLGLLLSGLVLSCLLLYNSADTLKFLQSSHLSSISRGAAVRSIPPLLVR